MNKKIFVIFILLLILSSVKILYADDTKTKITKSGIYNENLYSRISVTKSSGSMIEWVVSGGSLAELDEKCKSAYNTKYIRDSVKVKCATYNVSAKLDYTYRCRIIPPIFEGSDTCESKATPITDSLSIINLLKKVPIGSTKRISCDKLDDYLTGLNSLLLVKGKIILDMNNCLDKAFNKAQAEQGSCLFVPRSITSSSLKMADCIIGTSSNTIDGTTCPVGSQVSEYTASCESNYSETTKPDNYPIKGNIYQDSKGNSAYCIQPGKKYKDNQDYVLDTAYDIKNCKETSNPSFECGLASIMYKAKKENYGYATTLTALRLWTAYKSDEAGDGWWEKDGTITVSSSEKLYTKTANSIINSGYTGTTQIEERALIFGLGSNGIKTVTEAFNLFKDCVNGKLETISSGVFANNNNINLSSSGTTVLIYSKSPVVSVSANNGVSATIISNVKKNNYYEVSVKLVADNSSCKIKTVDVSVKTNGAIASIKRYRPSGGSGYQVMMVYDESGDDNIVSFTTQCGGSGSGTCSTAMEAKTDISEDCTRDGNLGKITDPLMDEILDTCRDSKTTTENAERKIFNTGTTYITAGQSNYCKLYCREEADITFMGVTNALAGRQFKYDLPGQLIKDTDGSNVTSTIVKGKKECVSVVDYGKWESAFEAAQDSVLTNFTAMKKWEALKGVVDYETIDPDSISCGNSDACCSSYEDKACMEDQKITKKETCIICTKHETELGPESCDSYNNYSFGPASHIQCTRSGCSSTWADKVWSNGWVDSKCDPCTKKISCKSYNGNSKYAEEQYKSYKNAYESALTYREQLYIDIQNCNLYSSIDVKTSTSANATKNVQNNIVTSYAGEYKSKINEIKYEDTEYGNTVLVGSKIGNTSTYYEAPKYCKGCSKVSEMGNNTKKTLTYYKCDYTSCTKVNIEVPTNTRARIQTSMEADYYQDQNYVVEAYTGTALVSSTSGTNQRKLDKYIYPVALKTVSGEYKIEVNYNDIMERFTRGGKLKLTSSNSGIYVCYYKVDNQMIDYNKEGLGFIFRQIDLKQIFGSDRKKGTNWSNATSVIKEIEQLGDNIWIDPTISPEYSVTLTAENRKDIREDYNKMKSGYTDKSLTCESGIIKCKSSFLTDIGKYSSEYSLIGRTKWR